MADTIFGNTPLTMGIQGYKEGVDLGNYRTQQAAETSLLSSKAEAAKIAVTQEKDTLATTLAGRAALTKSALANSNADMSSLSGQLKVYDGAIQQNRDKPEIVEALQNKRTDVLRRAAQGGLDNNILRQEKMQHTYDAVNDAFTNPDTGVPQLTDMIKSADDPTTRSRLMGIQAILQDKHPMKNAQGQMVPFSQLSSTEQEKFQNDIKMQLAPTAEQKALLATSKLVLDDAKRRDLEEYRTNEVDRQRKNDAAQHTDRQDKIKEDARHHDRDESLKTLKELTDKTLKEKKTAAEQQAALGKLNYPGQIKRAQGDLDKAKKEADRLQYKLPGATIPDDVTKAVENRQAELDKLTQDYQEALGVVKSTKSTETSRTTATYTKDAPARPKTAEEASKLPPGSFFLTPSGELRQL